MTGFVTGLADPAVLPRVEEVNRGFFEAAAAGRLAVRRCTSCDALFHYPRPQCPHCHSDALVWQDVSGDGSVVVAAPVYRPPWDDLPRAVPYTVAIVALAEGPRLLSTVEQIDPGRVVPGLAVCARFERVGSLGLVRFVPRPTDVEATP